ncbi:unnamed protein product [Rotaria magnacalcarata]|uniref:Uncharacterized protein n=1 Tax=Rotaria magnacalcarata TaxID=392030 RepID=A0A8S2WE19_9BILA|nr:unnamed protein product [Rotaria magnacalcarata]
MHAGSNQASKIRHSEDDEAPVHWHVYVQIVDGSLGMVETDTSLTFYILQRFYFNFHYLIINSAAIPSLSSDSQISSTAVAYSSSCTSLKPPKQGGRHRDFIWLYFNDISPAKTSGHRKAQFVNYDLDARGKTIIKIRDLVKQSLRARSNK